MTHRQILGAALAVAALAAVSAGTAIASPGDDTAFGDSSVEAQTPGPIPTQILPGHDTPGSHGEGDHSPGNANPGGHDQGDHRPGDQCDSKPGPKPDLKLPLPGLKPEPKPGPKPGDDDQCEHKPGKPEENKPGKPEENKPGEHEQGQGHGEGQGGGQGGGQGQGAAAAPQVPQVPVGAAAAGDGSLASA